MICLKYILIYNMTETEKETPGNIFKQEVGGYFKILLWLIGAGATLLLLVKIFRKIYYVGSVLSGIS